MGQISLHRAQKITRVVHSHPPSHYISKHAPGWLLDYWWCSLPTVCKIKLSAFCCHAATLYCAHAMGDFIAFLSCEIGWVFGTFIWRASPPQAFCGMPRLTSQYFGAKWNALESCQSHMTQPNIVFLHKGDPRFVRKWRSNNLTPPWLTTFLYEHVAFFQAATRRNPILRGAFSFEKG